MSRPQFIYLVRPSRPAMLVEGLTAAEEAAVGAHFDYLKGLADAGVVLLAGRTTRADAGAFGVVIFEVESEEMAQRVVDGDPAVEAGVMQAELSPFRVAMFGQPRA